MSHPYPIFGSQDVHDDDGAVIDSFFVETDAPPDLSKATQSIEIPPKQEIPRPTRIISATELFSGGDGARQIMPADHNRISARITVYSTAASPGVNDYVWVADEQNKVVASAAYTGPGALGGARRLRSGATEYTFDGHTAALWIAPGSAITASIEVAWSVVTK